VSRKTENTSFACINCNEKVLPLTNGSYRNHCPRCLYSVHTDNLPGDRESDCLGLMEPRGIRHRGDKGYQIIHRCQKCGTEKVNRIAPDDMDAVIFMMKQGSFL